MVSKIEIPRMWYYPEEFILQEMLVFTAVNRMI